MKTVEYYRRLLSDYWLLVRTHCLDTEVTEQLVKDADLFGNRHGEDDKFVLDLLKALIYEIERNVQR